MNEGENIYTSGLPTWGKNGKVQDAQAVCTLQLLKAYKDLENRRNYIHKGRLA